jgi:uncharacterized protein YjiK
MKTREIEKDNWPGFFDQVSSALRGKVIQIEVDNLELGAQVELDKLSLNGLTYDRKDDTFIVSTEKIEHVIRSPRQIFAADGPEGIASLQVSSADGSERVISFTEPLALPPAD